MLETWKLGSAIEVLPVDVYVNAKGLLMVHKPKPDQENSDSVVDEDELDVAFLAARGEPMRVALMSKNESLLVPGTIVAFPIQSQGAGCSLELRLADPDGKAVLIYADGLPPKSSVPALAKSGGDLEKVSFTTNSRGHAASVDMTQADDVSSGLLSVTITTKGCNVTAEIPWGKRTYHPL